MSMVRTTTPPQVGMAGLRQTSHALYLYFNTLPYPHSLCMPGYACEHTTLLSSYRNLMHVSSGTLYVYLSPAQHPAHVPYVSVYKLQASV